MRVDPPATPKSAIKPSGQRRFLKKNEVGKIILSPLAATTKYPTFQDRPVSSLKFGKLLKTVVRQSKNHYLLEYKKGDAIALLSEEKIRLKGQLWTKEWYIGYHQGRVGLVHAKNVLVVGKARPSLLAGPELSTSVLLEQILRPCKFLTYIYASVRTLLMENVSSWRSFADALGYGDLPLTFFCRAELDSEPERVASVLEKLKEDCNNTDNKDRKSFQKELMMVSGRWARLRGGWGPSLALEPWHARARAWSPQSVGPASGAPLCSRTLTCTWGTGIYWGLGEGSPKHLSTTGA